jgi:hypothetical protein
MCRPAGEIFQPFGKSVIPPPTYPGFGGGDEAFCATEMPETSTMASKVTAARAALREFMNGE